MLARVKKEGNIYKVEAFMPSRRGPQWKTVAECKTNAHAVQVREYVRYYAHQDIVARLIREYEARHQQAETNEANGYWEHFDND